MSRLFFPPPHFRELYSVFIPVIALALGGASPLSFAESLMLTANENATFAAIENASLASLEQPKEKACRAVDPYDFSQTSRSCPESGPPSLANWDASQFYQDLASSQKQLSKWSPQ